MNRWFLIVLFLSGCAIPPPPKPEKVMLNTLSPTKTIGVVSLLGDHLLCTHTGLTVFSNERQLYTLPKLYNQRFTEQLNTAITELNVAVVSLERELITLKNTELDASLWRNFEFNIRDKIDTLVIFDGSFHYKSKEGFYASDNALKTDANIYVYEVASGALLAEASQFKMDLKQNFSCSEAQIPKDSDIFELINQAVATTQAPLINEVAGVIKDAQ